ncbi:MAG: patatin-like phospholipase family protein [Acidimicrobiales bacterium]
MRALVLSGGENRGALRAGALEGPLAAGVIPDLLVDTSGGAIKAAFLATAPTLEQAVALASLWQGFSGRQVIPGSTSERLWHLVWRHDHSYSASGLHRLLQEHLPYRLLEQAAVAMVVATDLGTAAERCLSTGPVIDPLLALACIPGLFSPGGSTGSYCATVRCAPISRFPRSAERAKRGCSTPPNPGANLSSPVAPSTSPCRPLLTRGAPAAPKPNSPVHLAASSWNTQHRLAEGPVLQRSRGNRCRGGRRRSACPPLSRAGRPAR